MKSDNKRIKRIQGLLGTALAYSFAHRFMDKDPHMRAVWLWFALFFFTMLGITVFISRWKDSRSGNRESQEQPQTQMPTGCARSEFHN